MLERIELRHFAIARQVSAELGTGLTVITGETGAGKSILMDALAMALGERADTGIVRHGEARAEIEAEFDLHALPAVQRWLADNELDEDGGCVVRRVIPVDRASKAYINGRSVSAQSLRELGKRLVDIHSQHEHQSLLRADTQRALLDRYAGIENEVRAIAKLHDTLSTLKHQLETLESGGAERRDRLELLAFQIEELEAFAPGEAEWAELEPQHKKAHHLAELGELTLQTLATLDNDQNDNETSIRPLLHRSLQHLNAGVHFDTALEGPIKLLEDADVLLEEAQQAIQKVAEEASLDPATLVEIETRFSGFHDIARKHRTEPAQLYTVLEKLTAERDALSNPEAREATLRKHIADRQADYDALADLISRRREPAARQLSQAITDLMQSLAMEGGHFQVSLLSDEAAESARYGRETVSFEVSTNRGMPAKAIAKIASGGELSRISLAIQVVVSDLATVPTLVFDEVDVGVGGKTAATVGKLLRTLAVNRQILCITHLPQVAAQGDQHLNVNKSAESDTDQAVSVAISPLGEAARIEEIARMVGGEQLTDESLAHARTLIQNR